MPDIQLLQQSNMYKTVPTFSGNEAPLMGKTDIDTLNQAKSNSKNIMSSETQPNQSKGTLKSIPLPSSIFQSSGTQS